MSFHLVCCQQQETEEKKKKRRVVESNLTAFYPLLLFFHIPEAGGDTCDEATGALKKAFAVGFTSTQCGCKVLWLALRCSG